MSFRVYRTGNLYGEHERVQMKALVTYLKKEFANRREDCTVIVEPHIPSHLEGRKFDRKPDALIIKDNEYILVELKDFRGNIVADCGFGKLWTKDGHPIGDRNPFQQADGHRKALINFLVENFGKKLEAPVWAKKDEDSFLGWISDHVQSWILTAERSTLEVTNLSSRKSRYLKIASLDKFAQYLSIVRAEPILSTTDHTNLIELLKAKQVNPDELFRDPLYAMPTSDTLIPKITEWIESGEYENVLKALQRIRELELKDHLCLVMECWHNREYAKVRQEALLIIIEWQPEQTGIILNEALNDSDNSIAWFALNYLTEYGFPETIEILSRLLCIGTPEAKTAAIKAITVSGISTTCDLFLKHAQKIISSETHEPKDSLSELREIIVALGDLGCKESKSFLEQIIDKPTTLGFKSDDYNDLPYKLGYFRLFEAACKSLAKIVSGDEKTTVFLLKKLKNAPEEDYQQTVINALGVLGDPLAGPALMKFIENRNHIYFYDAVHALTNMKFAGAFDKLSEHYLVSPDRNEGYWLEKALAEIDRERFEQLLLEQIGNQQIETESKNTFLRALLPIASLRSAKPLFKLIGNRRLSSWTANILYNLSEDQGVFEAAQRRLESRNPVEKASAIAILENHFKQNLSELDKFAKDPSPDVRRVVAGIHWETKSKMKLLEYAKDPDKDVRSYLFNSITDEGHYHEHCFLVSDLRAYGKCSWGSDKQFLAFNLEHEILIFPKQAVTYSQISYEGNHSYGIYMEYTSNAQNVERILLVLLPRHFEDLVPDRWVKQIYSELNLPIKQRQGTEPNVYDLWKKVPAKLLKKQPTQR